MKTKDDIILEKKYELILEKKSQLEKIDFWIKHKLSNFVFFVFLDELSRYAEVDRNDHRNRFTNIDKLAKSLKENGFEEPIILGINKYDKKALVTDGNHRLVAAKKAGINFVPVIIEQVYTRDDEWGLKTKKIPYGDLRSYHTAKDFGFTGYTPNELLNIIKKREEKTNK
jgi:hypothetical protein